MLTNFKRNYQILSRLALFALWIILVVEIFSIYLYINQSLNKNFVFITLINISIIAIFITIYNFFIQKSSERIIKDAESNISSLQKQKRLLKQGIHEEIHHTLSNWRLTKTEFEICYLLLKGFSLVEISHFREISLSTCKEHARNIYKKAGVKNRSELVCFFLEDFLVIDTHFNK